MPFRRDADTNGNVTSGGNVANRTLSYTAFNLPVSILKNGDQDGLVYDYDGDHNRIREVTYVNNINTQSTIYIGNQFYEEINKAGSKEWRYYIGSPDGVIGVINVAPNGVQTTKYWLKDHLGSVVAEMDAGGANPQRLGFDAWGTRRNSTGADGNPTNLAFLTTQRGFTQHEMLDEVGFIHMNGRLYDPATGRFLQTDPLIQSPYDGQSYNRYSYVMNNPLSLTDPSGFSWWTQYRRPIFAIAASILTYGAASGYLAGGVTVANGGTAFATATLTDAGYGVTVTLTATGSAVAGAAAGFAAGGIMGGNLQSAVYGAVSGGIGGGISGFYGEAWTAGRAAANTVAGGIESRLSGGKFADGAKMAFALSTVRAAWNYTRDITDGLKIKSSLNGGAPNSQNIWGELLTDGVRNTKPMAGVDTQCTNWFTCFVGGAGMAGEGSGEHLYSENSMLGRFVNMTSKTHDFMNSWNYDWSDGFRLQGGQWFEVGVNLYSFAGMLPAAAFTATARAADLQQILIMTKDRR